MIVYNISTKLDWDIVDEWLNWQLEHQIKGIMGTNLFDEYKMYRLMDVEDHDGPTFTIQFFTNDKIRFTEFKEQFEKVFHDKTFSRWGNQLVSYSSAMELVN